MCSISHRPGECAKLIHSSAARCWDSHSRGFSPPPHSSWLSVTVISSNRLSVSRPRRQKELSKQTWRAVEDVTKGQGSVI